MLDSIDLSKYPNGVQSRRDLLVNLIDKLDEFLINPYLIEVGELDMDLNQTDNSYIDLNIPITYSFKRRDFEKTLKKMPYNTLKTQRESYIIEFLNDKTLLLLLKNSLKMEIMKD